jgi:hypothetical protein
VHIHSKPTLLLPEKMPLFQEVLVATAFARALPSHGVSPVLFQVGETIPPSFLLYSMLHFVFSLSQWRCNLHSHGSGPSLVSSILMAGKLALSELTISRNYPVYYGRIPVRDLPSLRLCRLYKGRVKRPITSIV